MTTGDTGRLDRIEQILEGVSVRLDRLAVSQAETQASLEVTRAIADSNARAIAAWGSRIEEGIAEAEEVSTGMAADTSQRLDGAIADTGRRFDELLEEARADRLAWQQQQAEAAQRFNNLREEAQADRQEWRQRQDAAAQRFDELLEEARADRQRFDQAIAANATEHRAFTQNVQVLLAEIARLWQRLAG